MANVSTIILQVSAMFNNEATDVYVYMSSTEPDNPFWGNGCRHKSFPVDRSLESVVPEIAEYLKWEIVCSTCHKADKTLSPDAAFCGDIYHVDQGKDLLSIFNENVTPVV